jgi:prepilin-type N-terminal cleavage/methylation domain-containing protein
MQLMKDHRSARASRRGGMGLVEVMISLAIAATLLTAAAAAFTASARAVEANDTFFRASQAARVSLNQILTEVRRSWSVDVSSPYKLDMETHDLRDRSYVYDATTQTLKLVTNDVTTDPDYTLCNNVTSQSFSEDTVTDSNGITHTVRVSVTLVIKVGENSVRLTGSAAPRRKQHLGTAP